MCITMGIAEAIAITTIVTANSFAISSAFGRKCPGLMIESPQELNCGDSVLHLVILEISLFSASVSLTSA
jgi:hypothetical protein